MGGQRYLLVGLGNPGRTYREHRHNVGYMVLDRLAEDAGIAFGRLEQQAMVASGGLEGRRVILAKPRTFMNASGRSVVGLLRFYNIPPECLLVIYDDLDLPLGAIRFRPEGGAGGHNGMKSILEHLGSQAFPRLRLGIGRPPGNMDPAAYVLRRFNTQEAPICDQMLAAAAAGVRTFVADGLDLAMSRHNGMVGGPREGEKESELSRPHPVDPGAEQ